MQTTTEQPTLEDLASAGEAVHTTRVAYLTAETRYDATRPAAWPGCPQRIRDERAAEADQAYAAWRAARLDFGRIQKARLAARDGA